MVLYLDKQCVQKSLVLGTVSHTVPYPEVRTFLMQYSQYLQTNHWQTKRQEKLAERPVCQVCKKDSSINIHHKKYKHNGESVLFNEKLSTLVTLCRSCHRLTHRYFGIEVKKLNKKYCRVRRLIELGVLKKKAFWMVGTPGIWESLYPEILLRKN